MAAHPGNACEVQCARIREALSRFSLTTFGAMRHLDVYDPRARVMQLRKAGERIDTHWTRVITEAGHSHRVGVYVLVPPYERAQKKGRPALQKPDGYQKI